MSIQFFFHSTLLYASLSTFFRSLSFSALAALLVKIKCWKTYSETKKNNSVLLAWLKYSLHITTSNPFYPYDFRAAASMVYETDSKSVIVTYESNMFYILWIMNNIGNLTHIETHFNAFLNCYGIDSNHSFLFVWTVKFTWNWEQKVRRCQI